jgi:predicted oxidoreductase
MQPGETAAEVVLVGSALAGLVAGAILSRRGKRLYADLEGCLE